MGAFNIIGKNHQVGFIIRMAVIGKHEIVDQLVGTGRLRALVDDHGSIEAGTRVPIDDIFKMLMADTLGRFMIDADIIMHLFLAIQHADSVQSQLRTFLLEPNLIMMSSQLSS